MNLVPHTDPVLREVAPPFDGDPRELEFTARQLHKIMVAGERVRRVLEGLAARIFQHELDHLNGVVVWP